ncbi:MAG: ATP-binding protein, partial [Candidatus Poribacteria bacterium]|nr:ATP-binding protein [Candidatus Poribacteria bacterium]
MIFNNRSISEITDQELTDLIGNQEENLWIDFKLKPYQRDPDDSEKYKHEICKDVTAMANAEGGYILIGVSEKNKVAKTFISVPEPDRVVQSIKGICRRHIDLPILKLEIVQRDVEWYGNHISLVIIHIPCSERAPHGFQSKGTTNYVIRDGDEIREYRHSELIGAFSDSIHFPISIQADNKDTSQPIPSGSSENQECTEKSSKVYVS